MSATKWFDDFNAFKAGTADLDTLLCNVLDSTFEQAGGLVDRILLTEVRGLACCCAGLQHRVAMEPRGLSVAASKALRC